MSQAAKQLITIILVVLLVAAAGVAVIASLQNNKLASEKSVLSKDLEGYRTREMKQLGEISELQQKFNAVEKEKNDLLAKIQSVGGNLDEIGAKIKDVTRERDELKARVGVVQKERDDVAAKLAEVSKAMEQLAAEKAKAPAKTEEDLPADLARDGSLDDEDYLARILKDRTALKMQIDKMQEELAQSALALSDLKKQNSDLQLEISRLNKDKEAIAREIKYGNDLAKNLSLELARAQNEKKFMADRMTKIGQENINLHEQLKNLTSTKIALERNIVKLQGDKKQISEKLLETEGVIQNRVDQIYRLRDTLESDFKPAKRDPRTGEVQLSPIVVNSGIKGATEVQAPPAGVTGSVVSINNDNNFVIVNVGEDAGIKIGDKLNIYRGAQYIAGLEVIQVRRDISAADIKSKVMDIAVGDAVR